ncbi:MAG: ABC transporter ATP-binding protein [bacterium]|nr:ABC transporter ATP-binding protein [bacterium]MCY3580213.1 ABC transporter ATP-binding protein [bacterium]MCY3652446.1 ABC transporter ATP-binding protein [bacterium]MYD03637.1 ABC transporter ATP-binding protein [Acidimicrobiia bacterium]
MVRFRPKRSPQPAVDVPDPSDHGRGTHPAVYVERATKVYNEGTPEALVALEDITMRVEQGEVVALLGPSGCGKSTLLKMIGGLYPATEGRIFVDGVPVTEPGELTGMMFQKPVLFPWLKVVDNVLLPVRTQGAKRADFLDRANDLIALAGLSGFGQRYPWELSGGMQQRVAICRMLMGEPKVLLLDEPFGALDEMTREYMDLELRRIIIQQNRSALLVTHNPLEAAFIGDRVVVMTPRPGKIAGEVEVPLGRDRSEGLLASDELNVYIREARSLLELAKDSLL